MKAARALLGRGPAAKLVFLAAALAAIGAYLATNWGRLQEQEWQWSPGWTVLALVSYIGVFLVLATAWRVMLSRLKGHLPLLSSYVLYFSSMIMRYIPGTVWYMAARVYLGREKGIPVATSTLTIPLELAFSALGFSLAVAISLPWWASVPSLGLRLSVLALVPLLLLLATPAVFNRLARLGLRLLRMKGEVASLAPRDVVVLLAMYLAAAALYGAAHVLIVQGVFPLPVGKLPFVAGAACLAWFIGTLVPLAPSGIGVREGSLSLLLATVMPAPVAVVVALLARLAATLAELACLGTVVALERLVSRRKAATVLSVPGDSPSNPR